VIGIFTNRALGFYATFIVSECGKEDKRAILYVFPSFDQCMA